MTRVLKNDMELPLRRLAGLCTSADAIALGVSKACPRGGRTTQKYVRSGRGPHAFLSHHLGDLDDYAAYAAFERDVVLFEQLFAIRPAVLVHDLHPDYASTVMPCGERFRRSQRAENPGRDSITMPTWQAAWPSMG